MKIKDLFKYHVTKHGTKIRLRDLDLYHLKNIIKFLERNPKLKNDRYGKFLSYSDYVDEYSRRLRS